MCTHTHTLIVLFFPFFSLSLILFSHFSLFLIVSLFSPSSFYLTLSSLSLFSISLLGSFDFVIVISRLFHYLSLSLSRIAFQMKVGWSTCTRCQTCSARPWCIASPPRWYTPCPEQTRPWSPANDGPKLSSLSVRSIAPAPLKNIEPGLKMLSRDKCSR